MSQKRRPYPAVDSHPSGIKDGRNIKGRYQERTYRSRIATSHLTMFHMKVKETDLQLFAGNDLTREARESVLTHRGYLESYIAQFPEFIETLTPWYDSTPAPAIVTEMIAAGRTAGVGPMAAVAGAIAESVGRDLLSYSNEVIVENGGDVFIHCQRDITVGLFAADSPLSGRIGIRLEKKQMPVSVCTSSASVGHSLSLGRADAACVVAKSCALADAVATSLGNRVRAPADIPRGIDFARGITGIIGVVIIVGEKIGAWGEIELVPL